MIDSRRTSRQSSPLSQLQRQQITPKSQDKWITQKNILYQSQQGNHFQDYYSRKDSDEHGQLSEAICPLKVIDAFSQAKQPSYQEKQEGQYQGLYSSPKKSQRENIFKETTQHPIFIKAMKEELLPLQGISIKSMNIKPKANPKRNQSSRTSKTSSQATNERSASSTASHTNQITPEMQQISLDNNPIQINNNSPMDYDFTAFSKELSNDQQNGQFTQWKEQQKNIKSDPSNVLLPRYNKIRDDNTTSTYNNSYVLTNKLTNSAYENHRDKPKLLNSPFQMFRAKSLSRKKDMINRLGNYAVPPAVQLTEGDYNNTKPSKDLMVSSFTSTNASTKASNKTGIPWIRKIQVGQNNKFMLCLDTKKSFDQTQFYFKKTSEMNVFSPFRNRSINYKQQQYSPQKQMNPSRMEYSFS